MQETWVRSLSQIPWRRKWQPAPLFLPGESHGQRSLVGSSPQGAKNWTQLSDFTFTFSQGYGFSSSHVWMRKLDCKKSWVPKNWCFWTVVLEKTLESPLDCKEIQQVHPKDQSWVFTGRTDVGAETPIIWPPDAKSWVIWKDSDAGRDWGQEEKGTTKDEMVRWHHRLNGYGFEWILGVGDGQRGLACCSSWGRRVRQDSATELKCTHI